MKAHAQWAAELKAFTDREESFKLYKTCPHFGFRTQRGRVQWMVFSPPDGDLCQQVVAEGWVDSVEEAWAEAVAATGTDRMYLTTAGSVRGVVSDRAEQRRQERLAAKQPTEADAAQARWLYSHNPSDYYRGQDHYPYRRHQVLKETKQFLFVSAGGYGECCDAQGQPNPDSRVIVSRTGTSYRVRKSELVNGGPAAMGSGWNKVDVWSDLEKLVAQVHAWSPQYTPGGSQWRVVLGLPIEDHLTPAAVKRAYRRSLLRAHPDHGGNRERLEAVQAAYELGKRLVEAG